MGLQVQVPAPETGMEAPAATSPAVAQRPDNVPEKFWDATAGVINTEAMLKSYSELEKMKAPAASPATDAPAPVAEGEQPAEAAPEPAREAAQEAATKAGIDFAGLEAEFLADGALSADTYSKLEAAGIPKNVVDNYIEGQTAAGEALAGRVYSSVGGEENFTSMIEWARSSLPKAEAEAFNSALDSNNEANIMLAVSGLQAKYVAANGKNPDLVMGDVPAGNASGYRSTAELTAAMSDPRYTNDPAYRADVERRLAVSDIF